MLSTVKSFKVTYKSINERNTFTNGDTISGQVTLEVTKEFQIQYMSIKFKGKAKVQWTERYGTNEVDYSSEEKYPCVKHYFIRDKGHKGDDKQTKQTSQSGKTYSSVVAPGRHVYPFSLKIPLHDMPSSFKGSSGKIVYMLEAKLVRSMRLDKRESTEINFVEKPDKKRNPELMAPQHESKDKKMMLFNSGTVAMDVKLEKTGFFQGERMKVLVCIENNSSREIKPKYCVYRKHSYFAQLIGWNRKHNTKDVLTEVGKAIPPSAKKTVTHVITIPHDVQPSILNCKIIKVEYRLRVFLDVKFALNPEIKFPIIILGASQVPAALAPPPAAAAAAAAAPNPSDPPPPYGSYGMYPPLNDFGNK